MTERLLNYYKLSQKYQDLKMKLFETDSPETLRSKCKILIDHSFSIMDYIINNIEYFSDHERENIYDQCKSDIKIFNCIIDNSINIQLLKLEKNL